MLEIIIVKILYSKMFLKISAPYAADAGSGMA
jgi:hypothetical protein